jgi:hypothetical protein
MDITQMFTGALSGVAGVTTDLFTAIVAVVAVLCICFGVKVIAGFLSLAGSKDTGSDGAFSENEFQDYARKKYKSDLYQRTYKSRGIGTHEDMGGDDL